MSEKRRKQDKASRNDVDRKRNVLKAEWKEQKPLYRPLPESDPFPIDVLGDILGGAVEAMSDIIQAPDAICANSILASNTLALQGHFDVVIDGRIRPTSNFFISIGESGERKSAVDHEVLRPHFEYQEELRIKFKEELKVSHREFEAYKQTKDAKLKKAIEYEDRLMILEGLGDEPVSPLLPFVISEEPTYEGLVKSLEQGHASQGLFSDEGGRLLGGMGCNLTMPLKQQQGYPAFGMGNPYQGCVRVMAVHCWSEDVYRCI